jgi:hypothetical protein
MGRLRRVGGDRYGCRVTTTTISDEQYRHVVRMAIADR